MATKFGDLIVRVGGDASGLKDALRDAIEGLEKAGDRANKVGSAITRAFDNLGIGNSSAKVAAQAKQLQSSFELLEKAYKDGRITAADFAKAQDGLRISLEKLTAVPVQSFIERLKGIEKLGDSFQSVGKTLTVALTAPLAGFGVAAVKSAADMESLKIGLQAVTKEAGPLETQLNRLKEVAKLPGLGFKEAVQGSINLQAAGFSAKTAERALAAFGNALATVGKGRADLDGVITALSQIASKGKVSAEEINQLAERLPQIRVAIKDAFGEGFNDAKAFEKAGIGAQEFVEKVIQQFEKLPKAAGGFKNDLENLKDSFEQTLAKAGEALLPFASTALKAVEPLVGFIAKIADGFSSLPEPLQTATVGIAALAAVVGPASYGVGGLIKGFAELSPLLTKLATAGGAADGLGAVSVKAQLLTGSLVALGATLGTIALVDAIDGFQDFAASLDGVFTSSERARQGVAEMQKNVEQTGGLFDWLTRKAQTAGSYIGDHFWEMIFPPAGLGDAWRRAGNDIDEFRKRFPLLESAAKRAQEEVNKIARQQAEAASRTTTSDAKKLADAYIQERQEALRNVEAAEKYLKMVKETKGSKDQLADATRKLTEAKRRLHPEFKAAGDAAGSYGKKLDEVTGKARSFDKHLLEHLTKVRQLRERLQVVTEAEEFMPVWDHGDVVQSFNAMVAGVEKTEAAVRKLTPPSKEAAAALEGIFKRDTAALTEFENALKGLGVTSVQTLEDNAEAARKNFEIIANTKTKNGELLATAVEYDQALKKLLESERELAIARGQSTAEIDQKLEAVNKRLTEHGVKVKGVKDSWHDFSKEVSTIITNFAQSTAKTLFDGTKDWGARFTSLWRELRDAVVSVFITPVTTALTKFVTNTLSDLIGGKGFGGIKKTIDDIGTSIRTVFGGLGAGTRTPSVPGLPEPDMDIPTPGMYPGQGGAGGASAAGGLGGAMGITNMVSGLASAVSSIIGNFQFKAMNKSLDIIVKHTLQTANDLANLRADEWTREGHLFAKLDDIWKTALDIKDFLGNQIIGVLENIFTAVESGSFAARETAEGVEAPLPVLERIITAITDGTERIVAAIQAGSIGGTSAATGGASGRLGDLQLKLRDMLEEQSNILQQLPEDVQAALKQGAMPPALDDAQRVLVQRFYDLHDSIVALQEQLKELAPPDTSGERGSARPPATGTSTGALDPVTMQFDSSKASQVVAVDSGLSGLIGAVAQLHEMIAANWAILFEILGGEGGGGSPLKGTKGAQTPTEAAVEQTAKNTEATVAATERNTASVTTSLNGVARLLDDMPPKVQEALTTSITPAIVGAMRETSEESSVVFGGRTSAGDLALQARDFRAPAVEMPGGFREIPRGWNPATASYGSSIPSAEQFGYTRPNIIVNVGNIRNRSDVDYLVHELENFGIRA